jgi:hypothetical protein
MVSAMYRAVMFLCALLSFAIAFGAADLTPYAIAFLLAGSACAALGVGDHLYHRRVGR